MKTTYPKQLNYRVPTHPLPRLTVNFSQLNNPSNVVLGFTASGRLLGYSMMGDQDNEEDVDNIQGLSVELWDINLAALQEKKKQPNTLLARVLLPYFMSLGNGGGLIPRWTVHRDAIDPLEELLAPLQIIWSDDDEACACARQQHRDMDTMWSVSLHWFDTGHDENVNSRPTNNGSSGVRVARSYFASLPDVTPDDHCDYVPPITQFSLCTLHISAILSRYALAIDQGTCIAVMFSPPILSRLFASATTTAPLLTSSTTSPWWCRTDFIRANGAECFVFDVEEFFYSHHAMPYIDSAAMITDYALLFCRWITVQCCFECVIVVKTKVQAIVAMFVRINVLHGNCKIVKAFHQQSGKTKTGCNVLLAKATKLVKEERRMFDSSKCNRMFTNKEFIRAEPLATMEAPPCAIVFDPKPSSMTS